MGWKLRRWGSLIAEYARLYSRIELAVFSSIILASLVSYGITRDVYWVLASANAADAIAFWTAGKIVYGSVKKTARHHIVAGAINSFLIRPALMWFLQKHMGPVTGIIVGKIISEAAFLGLSAIHHEVRKRKVATAVTGTRGA